MSVAGRFGLICVADAIPGAIAGQASSGTRRVVTMSNAFIYNGSYFFLVESDWGIREAQKEFEDDEEGSLHGVLVKANHFEPRECNGYSTAVLI